MAAVKCPRGAAPRPQFFTVHCWYEVLDGDRGEWRGEERHAGSDRRAYFRQWDKLVGFLEQVLAESEPAAGRDGPDRGPDPATGRSGCKEGPACLRD